MSLRLTDILAVNAAGAPLVKPVSVEQVSRAVFDILEGNELCSIATVTPRGDAHINTAHFCYSEDLELYFLSHPLSTHCRNMEAHASVAVTVFASAQEWLTPGAGLQLFGVAAQALGESRATAENLYASRFHRYNGWKLSFSEDIGTEYRFYRIVVDHVKVLDEAHLGDGIFVSASVVRD